MSFNVCVFLTVMETQTAIMDMDVFQTRLGVMLQYVTLELYYLVYNNVHVAQCV